MEGETFIPSFRLSGIGFMVSGQACLMLASADLAFALVIHLEFFWRDTAFRNSWLDRISTVAFAAASLVLLWGICLTVAQTLSA